MEGFPLPFWERLVRHGRDIALIDCTKGQNWSYAAVDCATTRFAESYFSDRKRVALLAIQSTADCVICYLGLLRAGYAIVLCDVKLMPELRAQLVARFTPDLIAAPAHWLPPHLDLDNDEVSYFGSYFICQCRGQRDAVTDELAIVMPTSGSSGLSKYVRLTKGNLVSSAWQVQQAMQITALERAVTSIPLSHIYGLSVLHSQLASGGSILLSGKTLFDRRFWRDLAQYEVTSFAGVPWTYRVMQQLGVTAADVPSLRKLSQSGGRLLSATVQWLVSEFGEDQCAEIFFMYGQTEACGRISVLPSALARDNIGSVGYPVPLGQLRCAEDCSIVYCGPNVMHGYASSRADLSRGDDLHGVLPTGDLGVIDKNGCLHLTGRLDRLCKIFGVRVDLDSVQDYFSDIAEVAALGGHDCVTIYAKAVSGADIQTRATHLSGELCVPQSAIRIRHIGEFPRAENGKVLYGRLAEFSLPSIAIAEAS